MSNDSCFQLLITSDRLCSLVGQLTSPEPCAIRLQKLGPLLPDLLEEVAKIIQRQTELTVIVQDLLQQMPSGAENSGGSAPLNVFPSKL
jgi:hypothetical protein